MALYQTLTLLLFIFHTFCIQILIGLHYRHYSKSLWLYTNIMLTVTLNFVFRVKWKCVKFWAYLWKIFYVLHPNANEMFKKKLRLFPTVVEVCGGKGGITRAIVDVTGLLLVLVSGVRGNE